MTEEFTYYKGVLQRLKTGEPIDAVYECELISEFAESLKFSLKIKNVVSPDVVFFEADELKRRCLFMLVMAIGQFDTSEAPSIIDDIYSTSVMKNTVYVTLIQQLERLFVFLAGLPQMNPTEL